MFFNNKFNTFFGLNLTLVYTFPMCMAWRFHFPIRNYDFQDFLQYVRKIGSMQILSTAALVQPNSRINVLLSPATRAYKTFVPHHRYMFCDICHVYVVVPSVFVVIARWHSRSHVTPKWENCTLKIEDVLYKTHCWLAADVLTA